MAESDDFDACLNDTLTILAKGNGAADSYGQESQAFSTVATGIACLVDPDAIGRPKEYKQDKQASEVYRTVYMRPYTGLTPHHWLRIASDNSLLNILEIKKYNDFAGVDPTQLHHFEVIAQLVIA